jgi:hypothetical protein
MLLACGERLVGVIEPEAHVRLYHHMQCRNLVDELGPPAESTDTAMEFLMADHPVAAASLPGALHAFEEALELFEFLLIDPWHRQPDGESLQNGTYLEDLVQLINRESGDDTSPIGAQNHKPVGSQAPKGFPHRHPAHADLGRNLLRNEPVARFEATEAKSPLNMPVRLLLCGGGRGWLY